MGVRAVGCLHLLLFIYLEYFSCKEWRFELYKFCSLCHNAENYNVFFSKHHLEYLIHQNYRIVVDNGQLEELMGDYW